ncbi:CIA30 family protein [Guyparkeria hydrothermalis]|uniref:CIA30 family protein n=1 Tax=Guyparkeria hydrothermalis TaxID=923 RepID=UPI0020219D51|nr:CIA30 family protein [Guyparkeria hydrothermalis]MCL7744247.1 CIA30 family protein [Guyparkeria hydrothermalis]
MTTWLRFDTPEEAGRWQAVNDVVMGGMSVGRFAVEGERGVFSGTLSLERGGGFASVRRPVPTGTLAGSDGVSIRLRGDGRRYQCRVGTESLPDGASYAAGFDTIDGGWLSITLPWSDFEAVFRGRALSDASPLNPMQIERFGFLVADRQPGAFRLEIATIELI